MERRSTWLRGFGNRRGGRGLDGLLALLLLLLVVTSGTPSRAQAPESAAANDTTTIAALSERLEATRRELQSARADRPTAANATPTATRQSEIELLSSIATTLGRALEERRKLDSAAATAPSEEPAPSSFTSLLEAYDELERARDRVRLLTAAEEDVETSIAAAQDALEAANRARREARKAVESSSTPDSRSRLTLATLESRAAQETLTLRKLERRADRALLAAAEARIEELEQQITTLTETIRSEPDFGRGPDPGLTAREGAIARQRETLERQLATAELQLAHASTRFQASDDPPPSLVEEVETLRLTRDLRAQALGTLEEQQKRVEAERILRDRWLALIRGDAPKSQLEAWHDEVTDDTTSHERAAIQTEGRIEELQERIEALSSRVRDDSADPELERTLERRLAALENHIDFLRADARDIARHLRWTARFEDAVADATGLVPLRERITDFGRTIAGLWSYEITTVDEESITVGNAILALALISLGFTLSRWLSHSIRRGVESRLSLEPGVSGAIQTVVFYLLMVSFILIALRAVNFPLTAFTVAGGAVAIGVGFGSQNVMNNFISGLILMLERPVRAQDLVEVESTHGTIEHIGARSTRIRATDGRHIIVPNSFFLENNVVNWTLSDDLIRAKVSVGIAYGSDTRKAEELIRESLSENKRVLNTPAPIIIFHEFGDNSLNFDSYFWVRARGPMRVYEISSELRFRIDDLFRENGVVIAFPQRDVHMDNLSPIEVRMLESRSSESESED